MEYFDIRTLFKKPLEEMEPEARETFEMIAEEMDGMVPKDLAEMLLRENRNPDYVIRIHRCLADKKESIFKDGLLLKAGNDLNYTTSEYSKSDLSLMISIKNAHAYKNPDMEDASCIICKIPRECVTYEKGKTKPILIQTKDAAEQGGGAATVDGTYQTILLPEYILGAVDYSNERITGFSENPNYKDVHNYSYDGMVCVDSVINDYYDKGYAKRSTEGSYDMDRQKMQDEQINNQIINEARTLGNPIGVEEITVDPEVINEREVTAKKRTRKDLVAAFLNDRPRSTFEKLANKVNMFFGRDITDSTRENTGVEK